MTYRASIVIATRNRCDTLQQALDSARRQTVPVELIVMDDGSTDDTIEMVRHRFPDARLYQLADRAGPCFQRTEGARRAGSNYLFPIDDDSILASPRTVEQTLADFDHARIGAVAIPFINVVNEGRKARHIGTDPNATEIVEAFVGAAHALRRDVFLAAGGYRRVLFNMGEEEDLCTRMLVMGFLTRLGRADPIHHLHSPVRIRSRIHRRQARNSILYGWYHVPALMLPIHVTGTIFNHLGHGLKRDSVFDRMFGLGCGFTMLPGQRRQRRPIPWRVYWLSRRLRKRGPLKLAEIEPLLPPMQPLSLALPDRA